MHAGGIVRAGALGPLIQPLVFGRQLVMITRSGARARH